MEELLARHGRVLTADCYRMLASAFTVESGSASVLHMSDRASKPDVSFDDTTSTSITEVDGHIDPAMAV